jgi:hypothetical protein
MDAVTMVSTEYKARRPDETRVIVIHVTQTRYTIEAGRRHVGGKESPDLGK